MNLSIFCIEANEDRKRKNGLLGGWSSAFWIEIPRVQILPIAPRMSPLAALRETLTELLEQLNINQQASGSIPGCPRKF